MSEQEGVRVFDRSTALALSPEANYRKWSLLAKQVKATHEAKMAVVKYIHEHGSLDGFKGKLPNQIEYTDKALGWDKLPGYEKAVGEMEIVIKGGANSSPSGSVLPLPANPNAITLKKGGIYDTPNGIFRWDGKDFEDVE
jgi:hypothetical protein